MPDQPSFQQKLRGPIARLLARLDRNDAVRDLAVREWAKSLTLGSVVLDIGAGRCKYAPLFSHCKYTPQDAPDARYAPEGLSLIRSDLAAIPLASGSVDAILCTEVLEHVENPLEAVSEFARLLKPGGRLFLSVPAACRVHQVPTHYYGGFAPDFFERSLPARGLGLERLRPIGNWSEFMAQELGRTPAVLRDQTDFSKSVRNLLWLSAWPFFRILIPTLLLQLSRHDRSSDLKLGWIAYAVRT